MITFNFIKALILHIQYCLILRDVYKQENLLNNLSSLFGVMFKKDWVGRIYTVINPYIVNGKYDPNTPVFELTDNGLVDKEYVRIKILEKLSIAQNFITNNNLFDILTYEISKIDDYDNYLFIMKPITFDDFVKHSKRFMILLCVLLIAFISYKIFI